MIERHWKGTCKPETASHYKEHLIDDTFKQLTLIKGHMGNRLLKRDTSEGIEFLVITIWDSYEAIQQFAGDDIVTAVVPKVVSDMMVTYDTKAIHYEPA